MSPILHQLYPKAHTSLAKKHESKMASESRMNEVKITNNRTSRTKFLDDLPNKWESMVSEEARNLVAEMRRPDFDIKSFYVSLREAPGAPRGAYKEICSLLPPIELSDEAGEILAKSCDGFPAQFNATVLPTVFRRSERV